MIRLSIIIPCFQNEGSIPILIERLIRVQDELKDRAIFSYLLVDDGSTDGTFDQLQEFKKRLPDQTKLVKLSRNFGSYNAFLAGMTYSEGDCHVYLHADLQDPPELISDMFAYYLKGNRLVIAYRKGREDASILSSFYHFMVKRFAIRNIPSGGFDLILFDEQIRKEVVHISEKNTNIVYLVSWLGYPYVAIPYMRKKREHGVSQWKFRKKVKLFVDTFFSFSDLPIYVTRLVAVSMLLFATLIGVWLGVAFFVNGWTKQDVLLGVAVVILVGLGISIGVLGEYINRIHETVRKRPNFVVEEIM